MNMKSIVERLNSTERAVSPVIGVILMVAITVILAAVIGTFVLDLGQSTGQQAPSASLSVSDASNDVNPTSQTAGEQLLIISHQGGDSVQANNLLVQVRNSSDNAIQASFDGGTNDSNLYGNITVNGATFEGDSEFSTGDSMEIIVSSQGETDDAWAEQDYVVQIIDKETETQLVSTTVELR